MTRKPFRGLFAFAVVVPCLLVFPAMANDWTVNDALKQIDKATKGIRGLTGTDDLDGHSVVLLELTPKSNQLRNSISKIQLWIDQANWLPIQQRMFHGGTETHLTVRYANLSRNDKLSNEPFTPKWPKGTRKQKP